ncbi:MAG: carboxypeptidase regulatory-like domain-containing protein [Planctomycetes bacterium]|nr:carboxypeptidase regulatory-like domain-containing protein [Planctomycetota bacterium]
MLPHSESPSTRKHALQRRSRWTTWIVLLGTLAVGATLLVTMRALFQVGNDMSRSVREARPLAPARERARPIESAESERTGERVAVAEERIHGRVVFPEGTPEGESAWVELDVPAVQGAAALHERAHVRSDGAFAFQLSELPRGAVVRLDAPHLYLDEPLVLAPGDERRPIELRPLLGACIEGRCVVPPELEHLRKWIAKSEIFLRGPGQAPWGPALRVTRFDGALRFELRGIQPVASIQAPDPRVLEALGSTEVTPPNALRVVADTPFLGDALLTVDEVRPGTTQHVELRATFGRSLAGRVEDEAGRPVAGALLTFEWGSVDGWNSGPGRDETDVQGRFELIGLVPWDITIVARRDGFLDLEQKVPALAADEQRSDVVLVLAKTHSIAGRVRWPDGTPAAGAMIAADPEEGVAKELITAIADDDGAFALDDLIGRRFLVTARVSIPSDVDDAGNVIEGRRGVAFARSVAADERELELRLDAGLLLRGRVVDEGGAPLPAFLVRATPVRGGEVIALPAREVQDTFHAEDGRFELANLHPGTWEVRASFGEYRSGAQWFEVSASSSPIELVLAKKPVLSGRVVDEDGRPARRVRVWFERLELDTQPVAAWRDGETRTDDEGRFRFTRLEPGRIALLASDDDGLCAPPHGIDVPRTGRVEDVELVLRPRASLDCAVVDEFGAPVPNARVELRPDLRGVPDFEWTTNDSGHIAAWGLSPASYELRAGGAGHVTQSMKLTLPSKRAESLRIVLARGALLSVWCTSSEAERRTAFVAVRDAAGQVVLDEEKGTAEEERGKLFTACVLPGTYHVVLADDAGRKVARDVIVPNLEPVTVEMRFER